MKIVTNSPLNSLTNEHRDHLRIACTHPSLRAARQVGNVKTENIHGSPPPAPQEPPTQMCRKRAHLDVLFCFQLSREAHRDSMGSRHLAGTGTGRPAPDVPVPSQLPLGERRPAGPPPAARISAFVPKGICLRFSDCFACHRALKKTYCAF